MERAYRYICKKCGQSFSTRSFERSHGLRSPSKKYEEAWDYFWGDKLSFREIARRLKVKPETISRWVRRHWEAREWKWSRESIK